MLFALNVHGMSLLHSDDLKAASNFQPNYVRSFYPIIFMPKIFCLKYLLATIVYLSLPLICSSYMTSQPSPCLSYDRLHIPLITVTALLSTSSTLNHFPRTLNSLPGEDLSQPYATASTLSIFPPLLSLCKCRLCIF